MRKFDNSYRLICQKCGTTNDVTRWQLQYVAPVLINASEQTYSQESLQVFCYACHYMIEDFLPVDTVGDIPRIELTAEEWLARAAEWIRAQEALMGAIPPSQP